MNKIILFLFTIVFSFSNAQPLVINELDADNPGIDSEEFIEIKSNTPNTSTNGYVLVFFNGSSSGGNQSYLAYSLNGYTTDSNGLLVLGSNNVTPFPQGIISENVIQNGADAIAIYQASLSDFNGGTLATQTNLIDALVYGTNDSDATSLMALLGETTQYNDNGTSANPKSLQRQANGSYIAATPTPRALNDGSGVVFNTITISTPQTEYNEGDTVPVSFTASMPMTSNTTFNVTLQNDGFNTADYTGSTTITILSGQTSVTQNFILVDDILDEGDEVLQINFLDLVEPIVANNNQLQLRVIDNDFTTAAWAIPTQSDLNIVQNAIPQGYYDSLNGLSGSALKLAITNIIANPNVVRAQTYADVYNILQEADQNPQNSNQVWLLYAEEGRSKLDIQNSSVNTGKWNREHTFPRSRAGYYSIEDDDIADGINTYWSTSADSLRHGNSDAHAIRAADAGLNSSRGNKHYGPNEYEGPNGNLGSFKGDVARSVLFLGLRYNGLEVVNGYPSTTGQMGDLATLIQWHAADMPDDYERNRNNVVHHWQKNRNPLIDMPELVDYIWGANTGQVWNNALSVTNADLQIYSIYPNPSNGRVNFKGFQPKTKVLIYSVDGKLVKNFTLKQQDNQINLTTGIYFVKLNSKGKTIVEKLIVN